MNVQYKGCYEALYNYLFPLVALKVLRDAPAMSPFQDMAITDKNTSVAVRVPPNKMIYKTYPGAYGSSDLQYIIRANFDCAYNCAFLSLKYGPVIINVPPIPDIPAKYTGTGKPQKRFWNMQLMDSWTNNYVDIGSTENAPSGQYVVQGYTTTDNNGSTYNPLVAYNIGLIILLIIIIIITAALYFSANVTGVSTTIMSLIIGLCFLLIVLISAYGKKKYNAVYSCSTDFTDAIFRIECASVEDFEENCYQLQRKFSINYVDNNASEKVNKQFNNEIFVPATSYISNPCGNDDDCPMNQYCVSDAEYGGFCKTYSEICNYTDECNPIQYCNTTTHMCNDFPNCTQDRDCSHGEFCDMSLGGAGMPPEPATTGIPNPDKIRNDPITGDQQTGVCREKQSRRKDETCIDDYDCTFTGYCNQDTGICAPKPCFKNGQCPSGQECSSDMICVSMIDAPCKSDTNCTNGQYCNADTGYCEDPKQRCENPTDCVSPGKTCDTKLGVCSNICKNDAWCNEEKGEVCDEKTGACTLTYMPCSVNSDCIDGYSCMQGTCQPTPLTCIPGKTDGPTPSKSSSPSKTPSPSKSSSPSKTPSISGGMPSIPPTPTRRPTKPPRPTGGWNPYHKPSGGWPHPTKPPRPTGGWNPYHKPSGGWNPWPPQEMQVPDDENEDFFEMLKSPNPSSPGFSVSPSPSGSMSPSPSGSMSPSPSGSMSPSPSGSMSPSPSGSMSPRPSGSMSPRPSGSMSPRPSGSLSPILPALSGDGLCAQGYECSQKGTCEIVDCVPGQSPDPCLKGNICDINTMTCSEPKWCATNADCNGAQTCDLSNNRCENVPCTETNDQCTVGNYCDLDLGLCRPIPQPSGLSCTNDASCADGMYCNRSVTPAQCAYTTRNNGSPNPNVISTPMTLDTNDVVFNMTAEEFYTLASVLIRTEAPPGKTAMEKQMIQLLRSINMLPINHDPKLNQFDWNTIPTGTKLGLNSAVRSASNNLAKQGKIYKLTTQTVTGWQGFQLQAGNARGKEKYTIRALEAAIGLGMNVPTTAIYYTCNIDNKKYKTKLDGSQNNYIMHFAGNSCFSHIKAPPVKAFWSLTVYGADGFPIINDENIYSFGTHNKINYESDGSITVYLTKEEDYVPETMLNWLPIPETKFNVTFRAYGPSEAIQVGDWIPPFVEVLKNCSPSQIKKIYSKTFDNPNVYDRQTCVKSINMEQRRDQYKHIGCTSLKQIIDQCPPAEENTDTDFANPRILYGRNPAPNMELLFYQDLGTGVNPYDPYRRGGRDGRHENAKQYELSRRQALKQNRQNQQIENFNKTKKNKKVNFGNFNSGIGNPQEAIRNTKNNNINPQPDTNITIQQDMF